MHALMHMDWATRLAWGLLAWPAMIFLAVVLSLVAEPGGTSQPWLVVLLGTIEVLAAAVAIVFTVWALFTWTPGQGDTGPHSPSADGRS
jgi:ABC-type phosphate transport system permease subunit